MGNLSELLKNPASLSENTAALITAVLLDEESGGGGGTPGGDSNSLQFNNADAFGGATPFLYDPDGLSGTGVLSAYLSIEDAESLNANFNAPVILSTPPGNGDQALLLASDSTSDIGNPELAFYATKGTYAAPEPVTSGQDIGEIDFYINDGTASPSEVLTMNVQAEDVAGHSANLGINPAQYFIKLKWTDDTKVYSGLDLGLVNGSLFDPTSKIILAHVTGDTEVFSVGPDGTVRSNIQQAITLYSAAGTPLPDATNVPGARAFVSDATANVYGTAYASGGSITAPVYSDGTDWIMG